MGNQCFKAQEAGPSALSKTVTSSSQPVQEAAGPKDVAASIQGAPAAVQTQQSLPTQPPTSEVSLQADTNALYSAGPAPASYTALGPPSGLSDTKYKVPGSGSGSHTNTIVTMGSNVQNAMAQNSNADLSDPVTMEHLQAIRNSNSSVLNTKLPPAKTVTSICGRQTESIGSSFSFLREQRANSTSMGPTSHGDQLPFDSPAAKHERMHSWTQQSESGVPSAMIMTSTNSAVLGPMPDGLGGAGEDNKVGQLSVRELNDEIQELTFIGQGAGGDVYRGQWQGATVAVKYIINQNDGAFEAASKEAVLGRLLAHPNVVQTFSCKMVLLDEKFFTDLSELVVAHHRQQAEAAAAAAAAIDEMDAPPVGGGMMGDGHPGAPGGQGRPAHHHGEMDGTAMVANSFMSGEGFGNPLTRPPNVVALQEVLVRANAKAGHLLTQIVMDHCDKGSLLQAIKRGLFRPTSKWGSKLALRALLRTAREVAQGMWHIHCSNVIHGDLKPGNVLLKGSRADRRGFVAKVSDFGLARMSERTLVDSSHWGTVHYMAPESFEGTITKDVDVWAFGVTLWQMVAGEQPYGNLHPGQVIVGVQADTLKLEWPAETHPRLLKLGLACLEHDRKKRPNFNYIMKELSLIESMVRLEGTKEGGSSDRVSSGRVLSGGSPFTATIASSWVTSGPSSEVNSSSSLTVGPGHSSLNPGLSSPALHSAYSSGPAQVQLPRRPSSGLGPNNAGGSPTVSNSPSYAQFGRAHSGGGTVMTSGPTGQPPLGRSILGRPTSKEADGQVAMPISNETLGSSHNVQLSPLPPALAGGPGRAAGPQPSDRAGGRADAAGAAATVAPGPAGVVPAGLLAKAKPAPSST